MREDMGSGITSDAFTGSSENGQTCIRIDPVCILALAGYEQTGSTTTDEGAAIYLCLGV
jgi:hypothetical protein